MAGLFKKRKNTMSERPNVNTEATERDQTSENTANPLEASSEAASGHRLNDSENAASEEGELESLRAELELQRAEHQAVHDKYLRLYAEFDNFRKRTAKERLDLIQLAGADTLRSILPAVDDMQRAIANNDTVDDIDVVKEGFRIIEQKMISILAAQGLKPMDVKGQAFDPELHEAITKAPAPSPDLKGKVIDVIENGYTINDKVIRYAKVVVGE